MVATASNYSAIFFRLADNPVLGDRLFTFRHSLFVDELGWSLPGLRGQERDQFDNHSATYCGLQYDEQLIGCFRAIPCNAPYLAASIFPHMARHKPYPRSSRHLEVSRLGVCASHRKQSAILYSLMLRYGLAHNALALVALADLNHERHLNRIGLKTTRYGEAQIVGFREDGEWLLAVAGEIALPNPPTQAFQKILSLTQHMEILDEAHVFGRERVPA